MDTSGNVTAFPPPPTASAPASVEELIGSACDRHAELLSQHIAQINELAQEAYRANPAQEDLLLLRHRTRLLGEDVARLFEREERGVFPMIGRLEQANSLRPCHVGMMRSRVRFTMVEQEAILLTLGEVRSLAVVQRAPQGPCEICRSIARMLDELASQLIQHHDFEQSILFRRATAREDLLASQIPGGACAL